MTRVLLLFTALLLISACEPTFKQEYEATKLELEATKLALSQARQQLKAADNEIRHKIFTLIRRANTHLQSPDIELSKLKQYEQELQVHIDSYAQLNDAPDHVSETAAFYRAKLETIRNLLSNSRSAFNRRYNECVNAIDSKGGSQNELSAMLCEVQADVAQQALSNELDTTIKSLLFVTEQQLQAGRQGDSSSASQATLEAQFRTKAKQLQQQRG